MIRRAIFLTSISALAGLLFAAVAIAETVTVYRATLAVKSGPGSFYRAVYTAKRGDTLRVISTRGGWLQVSTPRGKGWVFRAALGKKHSAFSKTIGRFSGTHRASSVDKTAGYKGFGSDTEQAYISKAGLSAQLSQVEAMARYQPDARQVYRFVRQGRLAR